MKGKYGARVYYFDDGTILVKQTRNNGYRTRHKIERTAANRHLEWHVDGSDMKAVYQAIRDAGAGKLSEGLRANEKV